jgi:hypothetical protein
LDLFPGASQSGVGFRVDIGGGKTMRPLKNVQICLPSYIFENFKRRNTLSILRIKLKVSKLHFAQNVGSEAENGQKGKFFKGFTI